VGGGRDRAGGRRRNRPRRGGSHPVRRFSTRGAHRLREHHGDHIDDDPGDNDLGDNDPGDNAAARAPDRGAGRIRSAARADAAASTDDDASFGARAGPCSDRTGTSRTAASAAPASVFGTAGAVDITPDITPAEHAAPVGDVRRATAA
jgi:hypothetical protein